MFSSTKLFVTAFLSLISFQTYQSNAISCENGQNLLWNVNDASDQSFSLVTVRDTVVGTFTISILDSSNLQLKYNMVNSWEILETHLWLGLNEIDAPKNPGTNMEQFPYSQTS